MATVNSGFDQKVLDIFAKYGISVSKEVDLDWDRRFASDSIDYKVGVDGDLLFSGSFVTTVVGSNTKTDEYGLQVLGTCLKAREQRTYREQAAKFKRLVGELMALKKAHKIFKIAEKRELAADCEKAANFSSSQMTAFGRDNFQINIPVLEDNAEKIQAAIEELKALQAENEKAEKPVEKVNA